MRTPAVCSSWWWWVAACWLLGSHAATDPYPNCSSSGLPRQHRYTVTVEQRDAASRDDGSLISYVNKTSDFAFNFAATWFPLPQHQSPISETDGLVVRVVECNPNHHSCANASHPQWTNAGALAVVQANLSGNLSNFVPTVEHVSMEQIRWPGVQPPPQSNVSLWGAADPRIAFRPSNQQYYLTWDNCTQNCYPQRETLLSTTTDPFNSSAWTCHGPLLPGVYTGGASLLFRDNNDSAAADDVVHYAFVSDSNTAGTLQLAESLDGIHWERPSNHSRQVFMSGRPGCWDAAGVAAGPQPEKLSSGDYLYIYNIDTGFPYHPNPLGRCAIGWAVLDGNDPTQIVARSDDALLTASLPWEQCPHKGYTCQETMVVFSTGLKPLEEDYFLVMYGGADTDVGMALIHVEFN